MNAFKKLSVAALFAGAILLCYLFFLFMAGGLEFPVAYPVSGETVKIIKTATKVETFEIVDNMGLDPKFTDEYIITKTGPVETGEYLKRLQDVLLSRWTYYHDSSKCIPEPPIMYRLVSPEGTVDVMPCFECHILQVFTKAREGSSHWEMGNRSTFLSLAKEAFPTNQQIQSLR